MRFQLLPLLALWANVNVSLGAVVAEGAAFDQVSKAMSEAGYIESGLDMVPVDQKNELAFWSVDDGVLIVSYSKETKKVIGVTFWMSDERPKATRQTFEMKVHSFVTDSGVMIVQTKPPRREQAGTGQPATRPESKSEGGDKPQPEAERRTR